MINSRVVLRVAFKVGNMMYSKIIFLTFTMLIFPAIVWASGGGPLILIFNSSVFIVGQLWIIGVEFFVYRRMVLSSKQQAFEDVLIINILSTVAIAFGLSSTIAAVGLVGSFLPGNAGVFLSAIGTWVYEGARYNRFSVYMALLWFMLLSVATVYFEAWAYKRRWRKRGFASSVNSTTLCWYANAISHAGLFVAVLAIWHELI
jgi:hypothetical protein